MSLEAYTGSFVSPRAQLQATTSTYVDLFDFTTKNYPDLAPGMFRIYADQSLTGFLTFHGAEDVLTADKHIWTEEGRRHVIHEGAGVTYVAATGIATVTVAESAAVVRVGEIAEVHDITNSFSFTGYITAVSGAQVTISIKDYAKSSGSIPSVAGTNVTLFTIGSEFAKGSAGMSGALTRDYTAYDNKPFIAKDVYEINGSDLTNVNWVEDGQGNEYWYLGDQIEARARFMDKLEIEALTQTKSVTGSAGADLYQGSEGLFDAINTGGNNFTGYITTKADLKAIIKRLDNVAGETINMAYLDRDAELAFDDLAAQLNTNYGVVSGSTVSFTGGNYGEFTNGEGTELTLSFKGLEWGGYRFLKQGWKILKNPTLYGNDNLVPASRVHGIMVPYGVAPIGNDIESNRVESVPYLTQLYKAKPGYSRGFESFLLGSVMLDRPTKSDDVLEIHMRTERMLRVVGRRKFFKFSGVQA